MGARFTGFASVSVPMPEGAAAAAQFWFGVENDFRFAVRACGHIVAVVVVGDT